MRLSLSHLVDGFGLVSPIAQSSIYACYHALADDNPSFISWQKKQIPLTKSDLQPIANRLKIAPFDPQKLLFAMQTYYALVVRLIAGHRFGKPSHISHSLNGYHLAQQGIHQRSDGALYDWFLGLVSTDLIETQVINLDYANPPPDALKALYQHLFPRKVRHALGEYYTPDWLAEYTLQRMGYQGEGTLLDPTCGSGTFLAQAITLLKKQGHHDAIKHIAGIDRHPLAVLATQATLILAMDQPQHEITLPIYCADTILDELPIGQFDWIAGNPPWVNWETLAPDYRDQTTPYWEQYGLFAHSGMEIILGKSKKDLSLLITTICADRYLRQGGILGFILTQGAVKTAGSSGFRRFQVHDVPLKICSVDDFSALTVFPGTMTRTLLLTLQKGQKTAYPLAYRQWTSAQRTINENTTLTTVFEQTTQHQLVAEPIDALDSVWMTGNVDAIRGVRKVTGQSDYHAHAGVYTGGANGVYWLDVLERDNHRVRVQNIVGGAKRPVPQVTARLEPDFIYPFLQGRDVQRWHADPSSHILVVQNPTSRQGYDVTWMAQNYPLTYQYLTQFETILRNRAAYRRYFRDTVAFYTMFDVGPYTFAPVKVVWQGFGTNRMQAAVVTSVDNKPIMTNQAMHPFIGLDNLTEAHFLATCLNSAAFEYAVISHTQVGGKSFAQPGILKSLRLPTFQANHPLHQALAELSQQAHTGEVDQVQIDQLTAELWGISPQELTMMQKGTTIL